MVELQAEHARSAGGQERLHLFTQAHQACRRFVTQEKFVGLGLKNNDDSRQPVLQGDIDKLTQDCLMAQMDSIERTDSCHTATVPGAQVV